MVLYNQLSFLIIHYINEYNLVTTMKNTYTYYMYISSYIEKKINYIFLSQ